MPKSFIVTVNGPAAAGKSTLIGPLAASIGAHCFSIGSLLRYITAQSETTGQSVQPSWKMLTHYRLKNWHPALRDEALAYRTIQQFSDKDVIDQSSRLVRRWAAKLKKVVVDGKHAGTSVFPQANVKLYLDAPLLIRTQRRYRELLSLGHATSEAAVFQALHQREFSEKAQLGANYRPAADAVIINTATSEPAEVLRQAQDIIQTRLSALQGLKTAKNSL